MDENRINELIEAALAGVNTRNQELVTKGEEADRVIAEQARAIAALKEKNTKKEEKPKAYCKYGADGVGAGNTWPRRDVNNEPGLTDPHHFDISGDRNYEKCVGQYGAFKHEFRTLAAVGSYLHDFKRDAGTVLGELRGSPEEDLALEGEQLTNTLEGLYELVSCRFGYIVEYTRADSDKNRLAALHKQLYPREGTAAPASKVDDWGKDFDKLQDTATYKLLAQQAAKASVGGNSHHGGGGAASGGASATGAQLPAPRHKFKKRG